VHGAPLGADEVKKLRAALGWPSETFHVPNEVREVFAKVAARNRAEHRAWDERLAAWRAKHPDAAKSWDGYWSRSVPEDLVEQLVAAVGDQSAATRALSGKVIQKVTALMPWVIGGAADLEPSTNTGIKGAASVVKAATASDVLPDTSFAGRNLHFGIREHAMGSIANGMALFGTFVPYCATFLVFSDYMRPPVRLAALMKTPTIFIFTHDSYQVGEDGPTHQPIEHVSSLRAIPDLNVWRPADGLETALAWAYAAGRPDGDAPNVLILTRQKLPTLARPATFSLRDVWKGGYVVSEAEGGTPDVTIIATGSEVGVAVDARAKLAERGVKARVVSMPCVERFEAQPDAYRASVVPGGDARVCVIEAGRTTGWYKYAGRDGLVIGLDHFGASAPGEVLAEKFGFTGAQCADRIARWLGKV
jgi:transketolase